MRPKGLRNERPNFVFVWVHLFSIVGEASNRIKEHKLTRQMMVVVVVGSSFLERVVYSFGALP